MIINAKWYEETENIAVMVQYLCVQTIGVLPEFGDTTEARALIIKTHEAVGDPTSFTDVFVSAVLRDLEAVICRCGECNGRQWTNGSKLENHFGELLDRGRSLNFVEPQEDEEAV